MFLGLDSKGRSHLLSLFNDVNGNVSLVTFIEGKALTCVRVMFTGYIQKYHLTQSKLWSNGPLQIFLHNITVSSSFVLSSPEYFLSRVT